MREITMKPKGVRRCGVPVDLNFFPSARQRTDRARDFRQIEPFRDSDPAFDFNASFSTLIVGITHYSCLLKSKTPPVDSCGFQRMRFWELDL